jgi:PAS domain S-box-containing protein
VESAPGSFTGLQASASSADQQRPDGIRPSQVLTSQVILEILEVILSGRSLQEVLTCVARVVEAQREDEGMHCSVWLLDEDRVHMRAIAAPTLPESYIAALDGFAVGPEGGTCGAAVNRREPIMVSDVLTDPILEQVRDVIAAHGIRTCWSAPIISQQGEILGTFAFNFRSVRVANSSDMQLMDGASRIAATAIERKRAEQALGIQNTRLRESQRELSLIIDNIPGFVWCASTDGQLTCINKRLSEYVGASVDNLWDTGWLDAVHPDDRERALDTWMRCVTTGAPLENQYRLRRADGVYRWFQVPRQLGFTSDGQPALWYGLLVDIEERKSAEQALRQQESELRQLLDFMPQLVVVFGPGHDRLYANRAALEYRGLGLDEWREAHTVHPDDQNRVRESVGRASLTGEPYDLEVRLCNGEGHYRWFLANYSPMHDEKGKVKYWYVALTDIEDRKKAEERLQQENLALREEVDHASMFEEIVGTSPALRTVLSHISRVAQSDSTVLISGETGTGKELIARGIHRRSNRASRAFISVNCAAIPRDLVLSELFGHEKGAFTGATQRRIGRFELADGGTIFLDEVGELSRDTQLLLLRVLQEREFERVGAEQSIRVNVRVIAATNRELKAAVANGAFREDLFYRLNVFPIPVPPLRERKNDILMLVEYFVQRYAAKAGKTIRSIDKKTLGALQSYDWPGNVRELQNVIERSVILTFGDVLLIDESWLSHETSRPNSVVEGSGTFKTTGASRTEREIIETVLAETRGRVSGPSGAAAKLRIPPSTLATRIKALKINRSKFKFPD